MVTMARDITRCRVVGARRWETRCGAGSGVGQHEAAGLRVVAAPEAHLLPFLDPAEAQLPFVNHLEEYGFYLPFRSVLEGICQAVEVGDGAFVGHVFLVAEVRGTCFFGHLLGGAVASQEVTAQPSDVLIPCVVRTVAPDRVHCRYVTPPTGRTQVDVAGDAPACVIFT
jgi:hypothetical protein